MKADLAKLTPADGQRWVNAAVLSPDDKAMTASQDALEALRCEKARCDALWGVKRCKRSRDRAGRCEAAMATVVARMGRT